MEIINQKKNYLQMLEQFKNIKDKLIQINMSIVNQKYKEKYFR